MSTSPTTPASTSTWNIDPAHSVAEFKVKHMMISNVKGNFSKIAGALTFDESSLANSHVEATIDAATILAKHDERYMPREVVDSLKKQGRWQEGQK